MNLPESLQQFFNYPPLQKIDPNTGEVKDAGSGSKLGQAAIPVVLTGLYKLTRSDAGVNLVLTNDLSSNWILTIFNGYDQEIINRVTAYSGKSFKIAERKLNDISKKAVELIREAVAPDFKPHDVKDLMAAQIQLTLPYLPPALRTGELFEDNTIDDNTHKMEGPMSNLMHTIEKVFTGSDMDEKAKK